MESPGYRDTRIVQLLVQHGARIDYCGAKAITFAVSTALNLEILKILASGKAVSAIISPLVPLAMTHPQEIRLPLLQVLLENGASGDHVAQALITAVSEGLDAQHTVDLLLKYKANVNYKKAEALQVASLAKSTSIMERLLNCHPDHDYFREAIELAMQWPSPPTNVELADRLRAVQLLTPSGTTRPTILDSPLVQAVQEADYKLIEYLIFRGANPNFRDGISAIVATDQLDTSSLHLLVQSRSNLTAQTSSRAFSRMAHDRDRWRTRAHSVYEFDKALISRGAAGLAVDQTFLSALHSSHPLAAEFFKLVLESKTALNASFQRGKGLCAATRDARFENVDFMLLQEPNETSLQAAFMSIFDCVAGEQILIKLARRFFAHSRKKKHICLRQGETMNDPLYQALHRHGDKPGLLQELLDNGCGSESRFPWAFNDAHNAEQTSPLLWLLCQGREGIDTRVVNMLLERGGE